MQLGKYVVWYENDKSYGAKLSLVEKYNLKGAGSWALGQEAPSIWDHYEEWVNGEAEETTPSEPSVPNEPEQPDTSEPSIPEPPNPPSSSEPESQQPDSSIPSVPQQPTSPNTETPSNTPPMTPETNYLVHQVTSGDTLWGIAEKYLGSGYRYHCGLW